MWTGLPVQDHDSRLFNRVQARNNRGTRDILRMTPERWKQIEELYHSAVNSGEEERAALFAQASAEVRATVLEMLAHKSAGNILDRPAWEGEGELPDSSITPLVVGTQLGPYKIGGIVGEGGMGAVYRAFDSRLSRDVAVKIL